MKKLAIAVAVVWALTAVASFAAANETYLRFKIDSREELTKLTHIMSIDNIEDGYVYAYACNDEEMEAFKSLGYAYEILPRPSTLYEAVMADTKADLKAWDAYPTYEAYVDMMYQFAIDYPDICRVYSIGSTNEGRELLFAEISDNVGVEEDEPEVMYTSTMHGDETTGYVLCLRLIDSILSTYGTDSRITNMVDNMVIYINPAANPDGTYAGGNSSVSGSTRSNANGVDLNRDYPDPRGDNANPSSWATETAHFIAFAEAHQIVLSANFHGGTEVVNYPFDCWVDRHADDTWWQEISRAYADTVHWYAPSGYMDGYNNGITNGFDWYEVTGGRQDYQGYFRKGRECTIELSDSKTLPASQLPAHWDYNRLSLLEYLERALYGVRGIVTNASNGSPLFATIEVLDHDSLGSEIWTDPDIGNYHRMIEPGVYTMVFNAPGFYPDTVQHVEVTSYYSLTRLDVALTELPNEPVMVLEGYEASGTNPGTDVDMSVTLSNIGIGNASGVTGVLSTTHECITITQNTSTFPDLQAEGGIGTSLTDFEFTVSDTCPMFTIVEFSLNVTDDDTYDSTLTFDFMVGDRVVFYFDDFSVDQGWTGLGGSGEWTIGECIGGGTSYTDPTEDHTATSDDQVLGNDLTSSGTYNSGLGQTYWVYSPIIDCSDHTGVQMSYWHWLGCESSSFDEAHFEVWDGDNWISLYSNGGSSQETVWTESLYDLSTYADGNPGFQMRWGIGPTDGSVEYSGWNIDDIELKGYGGSGGSPVMVLTPASVTDSVQPGDTKQAYLKIKNEGDASLGVWFTTTDTWLSFSAEKQTVPAGDSLNFLVVMDASTLAGGDHVGTVSYTSNDDTHASGEVPVYLHVFEPSLLVGQTKIEETVSPDEVKNIPVVVENNGPGRLIYQVGVAMDDKDLQAAQVEPIGYRIGDPDKLPGVREPYFAATRGSGGPDTFGHQWEDSDEPGGPVYNWIDISSVGTPVTLSDDDNVPLTFGFDFPFFDSLYSGGYLCSNGYLCFDTGYGMASNYTMPSNDLHSGAIAGWWDDLDPAEGGNVYTYHDVANGRYIISFENIQNYISGGGTGSLTFQIVLYANGNILLQYGTMDPGSDSDGLEGATVGIQNSDENDGFAIVYNAPYMHDNMAIEISASNWLTTDKSASTVEPYMVDTVMVTLNATDMEEADYTGALTLTSNDASNPSHVITVTMSVSEGCCTGPSVGNVDGSADNLVTMADLTVMIDHLFITLTPLTCVDEGNVDMSTDLLVTMADLTVFIDHLFITLAPLPACP